ncbi:MAG: PBP1A family penicillin-binding protein [Devosiaceae bacterium]|nr:PBP1A family penicillin-binding protein [Devosiaceae bacterium]
MDLRLSQNDRIGQNKSKRRKGTKPTRKTAKVSKRNKVTSRNGKSKKINRRKNKGFSVFGLFKFFLYWGFILGIWAIIALIGIVIYFALQMPSSDTWAVPDRPANIRIIADNGKLISNRGKMGGEAVSIRELPYYVPAAMMAIEDKRFMTHFGVDPRGILGAMRINLSEGRGPLSGNGGSTITQQVAKNLFLTPEQTIARKIQEALLAIWLENNYSKNDILELYLNRVYYGAGAWGIEAATQRYFGKSARNLSLGEAAILAGVLKAPSRLSPDKNPEKAAKRARIVLNEMAADGYISKAEAKAAAIDPNKRIRTKVVGAEYYVADWVEALMKSYIGDIEQDVIVTTTIDWDLQKYGEFIVREVVREFGEEKNFSQGALVAMNTDGTIRAIVGGTDYAQSQYNRAVTARRQPGSSFKPFVYLAGLEAGLTPDSILQDEQFTYKGWSPKNYSNEYIGAVTMRDALVNSLNTVAARLAINLGAQKVVDSAMRLGISSLLKPVPSIALGTQEVSLLELTAAYAPFANGGIGVIANIITKIETVNGEILYENIPAGPGRVIELQYVAMMNDMLSSAISLGTGKKAKLAGWQIAGKTGTTQGFKDAFFVGYSANMVTGIWIGNDDGTPMKGVGGSSYPAILWSQFMQKAHQGLSPSPLPSSHTLPNPINNIGNDNNVNNERPQTLVDLINGWFDNN